MATLFVWTLDNREPDLPTIPDELSFSNDDVEKVTPSTLSTHTSNAPIFVAASQYAAFKEVMGTISESAEASTSVYPILFETSQDVSSSPSDNDHVYDYIYDVVHSWTEAEHYVEYSLLLHIEAWISSLPAEMLYRIPGKDYDMFTYDLEETVNAKSIEGTDEILAGLDSGNTAQREQYRERFFEVLDRERALHWLMRPPSLADFLDLMLGVIDPANEPHMRSHVRSSHEQSMLKGFIDDHADPLFSIPVEVEGQAEARASDHEDNEVTSQISEEDIRRFQQMIIMGLLYKKQQHVTRGYGYATRGASPTDREGEGSFTDLQDALASGEPLSVAVDIDEQCRIRYEVVQDTHLGSEGMLIKDVTLEHDDVIDPLPIPLFQVKLVSEESVFFHRLSENGEVFIPDGVVHELEDGASGQLLVEAIKPSVSTIT